jgi:hypothetical protein
MGNPLSGSNITIHNQKKRKRSFKIIVYNHDGSSNNYYSMYCRIRIANYPDFPFRYHWHEVQITRCFLRAFSGGGDGEKENHSTYE